MFNAFNYKERGKGLDPDAYLYKYALTGQSCLVAQSSFSVLKKDAHPLKTSALPVFISALSFVERLTEVGLEDGVDVLLGLIDQRLVGRLAQVRHDDADLDHAPETRVIERRRMCRDHGSQSEDRQLCEAKAQ